MSVNWKQLDLGPVDAYAEAVAAGYTGTREEWLQEIISTKENADAAAESAEAAAGSAEEAEGSAEDAEAEALKSEGYAVGKQNGTDVTEGAYFENNAKYYKEQAAGSAASAAASAADAQEHTQSVIESWLGNNIDPETGYVLDRTLALQNAAAPADMVGELKSALCDYDKLLIDTGAYAHLFDGNAQFGTFDVQLKAGKIYTISLSDYPGGSINFYSDSSRTNLVWQFKSDVKSVIVVPSANIEKLYTTNWTTYQNYFITISELNSLENKTSYLPEQVKIVTSELSKIVNNGNVVQKVVIDCTTTTPQFNCTLKKNKTYVFVYDYAQIPFGKTNLYMDSGKTYWGYLGAIKNNEPFITFVCPYDISTIYGQIYGGFAGEILVYIIEYDSYTQIDNLTSATKANLYCSYESYLKLNLKKGYKYNISLDQAYSTIDAYTNSGMETLLFSFSPGTKSIDISPLQDYDEVYLRVYSENMRLASLEFIIKKYQFDGEAKPVIFDTDFGGDIDDLSAVATLLWAERCGNIDVIGVNCTVPRAGTYNGVNWQLIPAIDAVCNYYGVPDMAFGLDNTLSPAQGSNYCGTAFQYKHTLVGNYRDGEEQAKFYRRALASLPDGVKCDVCIVGFTTGFADLLNSSADTFSSKTGTELANEKVDTLWIVGGQFPNGKVETNLAGGDGTGNAKARNVTATNDVFTKFENRIVMIGAENDPHVGDILWDENLNYLLGYKCMNQFMTAAFNNGDNPWGYQTLEETWKGKDYSWDVLAVLAMCDGNLSVTGFDTVQGTCSINNDPESVDYGKNAFTASDTGKHFYVTKQAGRQSIWFSKRMDSIICERGWPSRKVGKYRLPRVYRS